MKIIITESQYSRIVNRINEQEDEVEKLLRTDPTLQKLGKMSTSDLSALFGVGDSPMTTAPGTKTAAPIDATGVGNSYKPVDFKLTIAPLAKDTVITSGFGARNIKSNPNASKDHKGLDLRAASGTKIITPADGMVKIASFNHGNCGGMIEIQHGNYSTKYCHAKQITVKPGDTVKKGQEIGLSGGGAQDFGRGNSLQQHLHFEVLAGGRNIDPSTVMPFLRKA